MNAVHWKMKCPDVPTSTSVLYNSFDLKAKKKKERNLLKTLIMDLPAFLSLQKQLIGFKEHKGKMSSYDET